MYRISSKFKPKSLISAISKHFERYGVKIAALLVLIELIWAASILVPVLLVLSVLFNFTNAWLAILPGFLGALTFLIILAIGGFAATLPSSFVARWRERQILKFAERYPLQTAQTQSFPVPTGLPSHLEIQDAD